MSSQLLIVRCLIVIVLVAFLIIWRWPSSIVAKVIRSFCLIVLASIILGIFIFMLVVIIAAISQLWMYGRL